MLSTASAAVPVSKWWNSSSQPHPQTCSLVCPGSWEGPHPSVTSVWVVRGIWKKGQILLRKHLLKHRPSLRQAICPSTLSPEFPGGGQRLCPPCSEPGRLQHQRAGSSLLPWAAEAVDSVCVWTGDGRTGGQLTVSSSRGLLWHRASCPAWPCRGLLCIRQPLVGTQTSPSLQGKGAPWRMAGQVTKGKRSGRAERSLLDQTARMGTPPPPTR